MQEEKLKTALESALSERDAMEIQMTKTKGLFLEKLDASKAQINKRAKSDLLLKVGPQLGYDSPD